MRTLLSLLLAGAATSLLAGCGDNAKLPEQASVGANPTIPQPTKSYIPTVKIAPAKGWSADGKPTAAPNLSVNGFAKGLEHPRWLFVLPNGDVLVAESNAPQRPEEGKSIRGWVYQKVQKWARSGRPQSGSHNSIAR